MKYLLIMRHAKSSWKDASLSDHDRPLNKRGKRTAPIMAQRLSRKSIQPQHIISSTAKRAWDTACIVTNAIEYPTKKIESRRKLFHAWPDEILKITSDCDDSINQLMLVGHNPGMTMLANQLLNSNHFDNIPTAGLVTLSIEINNWQELLMLKPGKSELVDYDYPKLQ
ncbi:MAG: histidine phosphatase family protein [Marinicellaceae bacterium]